MNFNGRGFKPGDYWMICDRCGFKYRQSQMKKEWTGSIVCTDCWEPRHPQEFVRGRKDTIAPPADWVRPEVSDADLTFVSGMCTTRSARAGEAIAGCAITSFAPHDVPTGTFNTNTL